MFWVLAIWPIKFHYKVRQGETTNLSMNVFVVVASLISSSAAYSSQYEYSSGKIKCVIGHLNSCLEHQKCVEIDQGRHAGYCNCLEGFVDIDNGVGRRQVSKTACLIIRRSRFPEGDGKNIHSESKREVSMNAFFLRKGLCGQIGIASGSCLDHSCNSSLCHDNGSSGCSHHRSGCLRY